LRDRLGLREGSDLEDQETADGIVLRPVGLRPSLVKKGSFWTHTGELPPSFEMLKAIDEDREEQTRKAWGS
jgi:bifunctional DNA-binding transcriptional regulator/antitoxin component of YhaV-PrlF toxin-antitoxin module